MADPNGALFYFMDCVWEWGFQAPVDEHNYSEGYNHVPQEVCRLWMNKLEARDDKRRNAASSSFSKALPAKHFGSVRNETHVWAECFTTYLERKRQ